MCLEEIKTSLTAALKSIEKLENGFHIPHEKDGLTRLLEITRAIDPSGQLDIVLDYHQDKVHYRFWVNVSDKYAEGDSVAEILKNLAAMHAKSTPKETIGKAVEQLESITAPVF